MKPPARWVLYHDRQGLDFVEVQSRFSQPTGHHCFDDDAVLPEKGSNVIVEFLNKSREAVWVVRSTLQENLLNMVEHNHKNAYTG